MSTGSRLFVLSALTIVGAVVLSITGNISDAYWLLTSSVVSGTVGATIPVRKETV